MSKLGVKFAVAVIVVMGALLPLVSAQTREETRGQGLEISPPLITLEADPGETVVVEISLRNITAVDVVARGVVNDFVAQDESGEPQILLDDSIDSAYPLAAYISEVPDLEIAPGQQEVVRLPIVIPEDASPGAHMGVVRFNAVPAESSSDGSQVSLSASIGSLILINVSGDIEIDLSIEEVAVSQDGEAGSFFEQGPLTFITRLNNQGNVYMQPSGTLRVTNMFGQEVEITPLETETSEAEADATKSIEFNPTERNVLPDSIRRFEQSVDKSWWFGRYTLMVDVTYGDGETLQESVSFWVIPYKLVAIVLALLIILGFFGRRTLKAYNRRIIERARQSEGVPHSRTPIEPYQGPQN